MNYLPLPGSFWRRKLTLFAIVVGLITAAVCWSLLPFQRLVFKLPRGSSYAEFFSDFRYVATQEFFNDCLNRRVTLMELGGEEPLFSLVYDEKNLPAFGISPDNKLFIEFGLEKTKVRKIPSGELIAPEHPFEISNIQVKPDYRFLLIRDAIGRSLVLDWDETRHTPVAHDVLTGKALRNLTFDHDNLSFDMDSKGADGEEKIKEIWLYNVWFFPGRFLEYCQEKNKLLVRELPGGEIRGELVSFLKENDNSRDLGLGLYLTADCKTVVSCINQEIVLWDVATGQHRKLNVNGVHAILSPDGRFVIFATQRPEMSQWLHWLMNWFEKEQRSYPDVQIVVYDLTTETPLASFDTDLGFSSMTFSDDGKSLAIRAHHAYHIYDFPLRKPWLKSAAFGFAMAIGVWGLGWFLGRLRQRSAVERFQAGRGR